MPGTCIEMNEDFIKKGENLLTTEDISFQHTQLLVDDEVSNSKLFQEASKVVMISVLGFILVAPLANL